MSEIPIDDYEWTPEQGELIEVSDNKAEWETREFVGMTLIDMYCCMSEKEGRVETWKFARPVQKFPILKKSTLSDLVVMFTDTTTGYVIIPNENYELGHEANDWTDCCDTGYWKHMEDIPNKALVWCWDDDDVHAKDLRFYNSDNQVYGLCPPEEGSYNIQYNNYKIVNTSRLEPEVLEWAKEDQKTLGAK